MIQAEQFIKDISQDDFINESKVLFFKLVRNIGSSMANDGEKLKYFIKEVFNIVSVQMTNMRYGDLTNFINQLSSGVIDFDKSITVVQFIKLLKNHRRDASASFDAQKQANISEWDNLSTEEKELAKWASIAYFYRFNRGINGKDTIPSFDDHVKMAREGKIKEEKIKVDCLGGFKKIR